MNVILSSVKNLSGIPEFQSWLADGITSGVYANDLWLPEFNW